MKYPFLREITAADDLPDREEDEADSPELEYRSAKRILHGDVHKIEVRKWYECDPADAFMHFWDTSSAYSFLRRFMYEPLNMRILRNVLGEANFAVSSIYRLRDDEVLRRLAWKVARGEIRLVPRVQEERRIIPPAPEPEFEEEAPPARGEPVTVAAEPAAPEVVPEQVVEPVLEPEPVVEEPLVPATAAAAQAAVMLEAAKFGMPFCDT